MGFALFHCRAALVPVAFVLATILGVAAGSAAAGAVASATPWIASTNSKVRLVSGTVDLDGTPAFLVGIQLRLDPGWKTYWKNPGDSGVPPKFDWAGSTNLKRAELFYPAPHRFADANGTAIGYEDEVIFPVKLTPEREGDPIELKLVFAYGLCKDLCIPSDVSLEFRLPANAGKGDAALLESTLARVPAPAKEDVLPQVTSVAARLDGEKPELIVEALFPPGATGTDLFIDAGNVFVPVPMPLGPLANGEQRFAATFATQKEAAAIKGKTLALTLISDQGSTETAWKAE